MLEVKKENIKRKLVMTGIVFNFMLRVFSVLYLLALLVLLSSCSSVKKLDTGKLIGCSNHLFAYYNCVTVKPINNEFLREDINHD